MSLTFAVCIGDCKSQQQPSMCLAVRTESDFIESKSPPFQHLSKGATAQTSLQQAAMRPWLSVAVAPDSNEMAGQLAMAKPLAWGAVLSLFESAFLSCAMCAAMKTSN